LKVVIYILIQSLKKDWD